ncbi:hypothetical protein ARMGADRAFT_1168391 [Armillaria gallica]|uniref:Polyketide synthase-like phosphopantetheine-binding domain-containing protein n=1 Tax=Armillaria gallica TaxID=47427 RepID=A0A2H3DHB0_ARMGA|nr:hypothetical protein ARMGADRAFT_1168391 [Armillaria gallica]
MFCLQFSDEEVAPKLKILELIWFSELDETFDHILRSTGWPDASWMCLGFTPFPISTRNSVAAIVHLVKSTGTRHLIVSQDASLQITADMVCRQFWDADNKITTIPMLHFGDLSSGKPGSYERLPPVRPDWSPTALIIHSSGSTRFPGPIYNTHNNVLRNAGRAYRGELDIIPSSMLSNGVMLKPCLDAMAFYFSISLSTVTGTIYMLLASRQTTLVIAVPSFLVEWALDPKAVETLKSTTAVIQGGGLLEKDAGDSLVANGVLSIYGLRIPYSFLRLSRVLTVVHSTEYGVSAVLPKSIPAEGWEWMKVANNVDAVFMPTDEKDIFRVYVKESLHHSPAVLDTEIDGIRALATKDLVQLHPLNQRLFKVYGRVDDQIMHSTGEKTNPSPIEAGLNADKRVAAALMFGRSKFQPGVLILSTPEEAFELSDATRLAEYRASIWDTITKVNEPALQHSRIYKETLKNVMTMVRDIVTAVFARNVDDTEDIFVVGGDSLTAMSIRNSVLRALRTPKVVPVAVIRALPPNFVFDLPSISAMSAFIHGIVLGAQASPATELSTRSEEVEEPATHREFDLSPDQSQTYLLLVVLLKLFEDNGDEVTQAVKLDHFPAMFVYSANRLRNPDPRVQENIRNMLDVGMSAIEGLMDRDSNRDTPQRAKNLLLDGWKGVYASDAFRNAIRNIKGSLTTNAEFVYDLTTDETGVASIELMDGG